MQEWQRNCALYIKQVINMVVSVANFSTIFKVYKISIISIESSKRLTKKNTTGGMSINDFKKMHLILYTKDFMIIVGLF